MIYVDPLVLWDAHGYPYWCHLGIDQHEDLTALHTLAARIGLQRRWFQNKPGHPHYDLAGKGKRDAAIRAGAVPVDHGVYVAKCSKNFHDIHFTENEKRAMSVFRKENTITIPHLPVVLRKLRAAGYRFDALSEAWKKPESQLLALHELPESTGVPL